MLPLLRIQRMKARDLVGYAVLQLIVHIPIVFFLCWLFARYMVYLPPVKCVCDRQHGRCNRRWKIQNRLAAVVRGPMAWEQIT